MKKKEKEKAMAVLATAEVQNSINLNLNSNDVVELMIEESKEILVKQYQALTEKVKADVWIDYKHPSILKIVLDHFSADPILKMMLKHFKHVMIYSDRMYLEPLKRIKVYSFEEEDERDRYYRTADTYHVLTVNQKRIDLYFSDMPFSEHNEKGQTATIGFPVSLILLKKINIELELLNKGPLANFNALEEVGKQIKAISNKAKTKSRFIRSILEKSTEGRQVLANIAGLSLAPKQLGK